MATVDIYNATPSTETQIDNGAVTVTVSNATHESDDARAYHTPTITTLSTKYADLFTWINYYG